MLFLVTMGTWQSPWWHVAPSHLYFYWGLKLAANLKSGTIIKSATYCYWTAQCCWYWKQSHAWDGGRLPSHSGVEKQLLLQPDLESLVLRSDKQPEELQAEFGVNRKEKRCWRSHISLFWSEIPGKCNQFPLQKYITPWTYSIWVKGCKGHFFISNN